MITRQLDKWRSHFALGSPPSTGMKEALQWLMLARLGVLYAILGVIVLQQVVRRDALVGHSLLVAYGLLAASFGFNLFQAVFVERIPARWWVAAVHIAFDVAATSAWILLSGGKDSLFALLYLVQILFVALTFYQRGAILASGLACVGFGIVVTGGHAANGLLTWGIYAALFVTLGMVGGYLSEELVRTSQSLKEKSRKVERLMALQERIVKSLPTGLLTVDSHMTVHFINPAGEHILNHRSRAIVGKKLADVEPGLLPFFTQIPAHAVDEEARDADGETGLSATDEPGHRSFFVSSRSEKGVARLQQRVEIGRGAGIRILRGDVAALDADAGLGGLLDEAATGGWVLLFQEVTKLVHLEEKLKQNEKLAAVGQLAAGIAHEIRNPLASMSASIEMLKGSLPPTSGQEENQRLMEIAIREIDRLNRLITEFLGFVKPERFRFESVSLDEMLRELVGSVGSIPDVKGRITFKENCNAGTVALANGEKLKQVALNLLINAVQATVGKGAIEVGCSAVSNQRVKFWVEDRGTGMSEEVLGHLYEPFFTTKDKGTGLGLATAYKIVEAHHGEIKVSSKVSQGTRFEVFLQSA